MKPVDFPPQQGFYLRASWRGCNDECCSRGVCVKPPCSAQCGRKCFSNVVTRVDSHTSVVPHRFQHFALFGPQMNVYTFLRPKHGIVEVSRTLCDTLPGFVECTLSYLDKRLDGPGVHNGSRWCEAYVINLDSK